MVLPVNTFVYILYSMQQYLGRKSRRGWGKWIIVVDLHVFLFPHKIYYVKSERMNVGLEFLTGLYKPDLSMKSMAYDLSLIGEAVTVLDLIGDFW